MNTRNIGNIGEDIACIFLKKRGFTIVARNYQRKWGEIDIIAGKGGIVHFFEVKSATADFSHAINAHKPEDNVHGLKRKHIGRMIETFLSDRGQGMDVEFQFHVLTVYLDERMRRAQVKLLENIILC